MIEDSPLSTIFSATPVPTSDKYNDTWWHDKYEAWDEGEDIYVTTFDIVAMVKGHEDHEYMATNCDIVSLLLSAPSASSVHGKEIIRQTAYGSAARDGYASGTECWHGDDAYARNREPPKSKLSSLTDLLAKDFEGAPEGLNGRYHSYKWGTDREALKSCFGVCQEQSSISMAHEMGEYD